MYFHLHYTTTTISHILHYKHTYIYIYTKQQQRYPISFITNTHIFTFILYNNDDTPYPSLQTHIFTFILNNNYDTPYPSLQAHIYLHLYNKTTTIPHIFHYKHTHIYIYTILQLRSPISFITNTHIFTFILYNNYDIPYLSLQTHIYLHLY